MNDITERRRPTEQSSRRRHRRLIISITIAGAAICVIATCALVGSVMSADTANGDRLNTFDDPTETSAAGYAAADGYIPEGESLRIGADHPALTKLDPRLYEALVAAGEAAQTRGVTVLVTSGWRSAEFQQSLLSGAIAEYGEEHARRVVKSPSDSEHVAGRAVDIGPTEAADWISRFGSEYGLCQTYANELWHYELTASNGQCPAMRSDASS